ncbi:MAG: 50S ribosomal protein L11 methyltransferase [Dehalococcoidia bacterium]|nr:50S ribosomal protein L11 methyltransferase [Dehalococcoidia bacterium]
MLWYEITATAAPADLEAVASLMRDVAPGGVTIEEPVDLLGPEQGFRVRGGEAVLVRAYLPASELGAVLTEELRRAMAALPQVQMVAKPLYEQDWAVSWREFFGVVEPGGRVVVVPSWLEHEPSPGEIVLRLDPGQAFGTGHHETTRLCLLALEELLRPGDRVLDVGTGSGILAIAALRLGAGSVLAIDVDPVAAEVARANVAANGVEGRVVVEAGRLESDHAGTYDLVIANISTEANIALAPAFGRVTAAGGRIALSGILAADVPRVRAAMTAEGFALDGLCYERDWSLLALRRPA